MIEENLNSMHNSMAIMGDMIKQIYEERIEKLPEFEEFEKIHNKTNGKSLYELFSFEPKTWEVEALQSFANSESEFKKSKIKGEWEYFTHFAKVFEYESTKDNYDKYYRFLLCKKNLEDIQKNGKSVKLTRYRNTVKQLTDSESVKNSEQAEKLICSFCKEIGLQCEPISEKDYKIYLSEQESKVKTIEIKVEELKKIQNETESYWNSERSKIEDFMSSVNAQIIKKGTQKQEIEGYAISKDYSVLKENTKDLNNIFDEIKNFKQEIEKFYNSRLDIVNSIEKEVSEAENLYNNAKTTKDPDEDVNFVYNTVGSKYEIVKDKYNKFTNQNNWNIEKSYIEKKKTDFENQNNIFDNKVKDREQIENSIHNDLKGIIKHQNKPITKIFIGVQGVLLLGLSLFFSSIDILFFTAYDIWKWIIFSINSIFLICYVYLVIKEFNIYNKAVDKLNCYWTKKVDCRPTSKLILSIALACLIFVFVQLCILTFSTWVSIMVIIIMLLSIAAFYNIKKYYS